jgi:hypothetical protein
MLISSSSLIAGYFANLKVKVAIVKILFDLFRSQKYCFPRNQAYYILLNKMVQNRRGESKNGN